MQDALFLMLSKCISGYYSSNLQERIIFIFYSNASTTITAQIQIQRHNDNEKNRIYHAQFVFGHFHLIFHIKYKSFKIKNKKLRTNFSMKINANEPLEFLFLNYLPI